MGFESEGWDPALRPETTCRPADAVNLGYVLNVIENAAERAQTLRKAWDLCQTVLVAAARIVVGDRGGNEVSYADGVLTQIGTFQKFFTQSELRSYLEEVLGLEVIPAALGVFYAFKDDELRQAFIARRYRRRSAAPRKRISEIRFEANREILEPLMDWVADRRRLPEEDEFAGSGDIVSEFGSLRRAFGLIRRVTGDEEWGEIRRRRTEDLLIYLALANFRQRPRFSRLPTDLQRDVRAFFGTYTKGCARADELLFSVGDPDAVDQACRESEVGKLLPNALYVHRSAVPNLSPLLRVYEGCARAYVGEVEGANIIKLHRFSGKISYLYYPDFERKPHPALFQSLKVSLRDLEVHHYDYASSSNPPILHRKETFLPNDHPLHERFSKLSQQEEKHGRLDDASEIGTLNGWEERLKDRGYRVRGHRLMKRKGDT